jgi:nucleotide-binding universal stress UspA family protein
VAGPVVLPPVVVAVGRDGSGAAVSYGARAAHRASRPLTLVHVAPLDHPWRVRVGHDLLRAAAARADAEDGAGPSSCVLLHGDLTQEVARVAAGAHLLVVHPPSGRLVPGRPVSWQPGGASSWARSSTGSAP